MGVPGLLESRWQLKHFGDLDARIPLVKQPKRLVVQVRVHIALQRHEFDDALAPPGRPVMRGEHDVSAVGEGVNRLGQVARPRVRVTHQGAPQRQQVMQVVSGVLGHAQSPEAREIEMHFGGSLGPGCHLEFDLHTVDGVLFTGRSDVDGRDDDRYLTSGRGLAESAAHLVRGSAGQQGAVHVRRPPRHCRTGVDVFLHRMFDESFGCQHRDRAAVHVRLRGDAQHAAEMVDVAVGVYHRDHGALAAPVRSIQMQRRGRHLG